jgi:indole-3-glycerol phosphate synthase
MSTILERIVQLKTREVRLAVERMPLAELKEIAATQDVRDFTAALHAKNSDGLPGVIAEVKKASPALGILRPDFEPESIARSYGAHGSIIFLWKRIRSSRRALGHSPSSA